jgi:hypothetical protein
MEEFAKIYVPLISAMISLLSVSIALTALRYSRQDRREQQSSTLYDGSKRDSRQHFRVRRNPLGSWLCSLHATLN